MSQSNEMRKLMEAVSFDGTRTQNKRTVEDLKDQFDQANPGLGIHIFRRATGIKVQMFKTSRSVPLTTSKIAEAISWLENSLGMKEKEVNFEKGFYNIMLGS